MSMKINNCFRTLLGSVAVFLVSCAGNVDPQVDDAVLLLEADKTTVEADGVTEVVFKVWNGNEDVTSSAAITCTAGGAEVKSARFIPEVAGEYVFEASYLGKKSEPVSVTVTEVQVQESRFKRHVCVMEFTGTKCAQCPEGAATISYLVNRAYKGQAFALAFHNSEDDPYHVAEELELKKIFKYSTYPSYLTDMRSADCGELNQSTGCSSSIEKSLYDVPTHCGVSVGCTYDQTSATVTVDAKVFSEKTMNYRMVAYVIEDNIRGPQLLSTGSVQQDYIHHHVVRKLLSADVRGDSLGEVASEKEVSKTYTFKVDPTWKAEDLTVAVLALDKNNHVNNMAVCAAVNGRMDYEMNK